MRHLHGFLEGWRSQGLPGHHMGVSTNWGFFVALGFLDEGSFDFGSIVGAPNSCPKAQSRPKTLHNMVFGPKHLQI